MRDPLTRREKEILAIINGAGRPLLPADILGADHNAEGHRATLPRMAGYGLIKRIGRPGYVITSFAKMLMSHRW